MLAETSTSNRFYRREPTIRSKVERMSRKTFYIDGSNFFTLAGFFREITKALVPDAVEGWIHNLDAFNDMLYRADEKPQDGYILVWRNSDTSRERLGYSQTILELEKNLLICHPLNRPIVQDRILLAKQNKGPTLFDELVEILRVHDDIQLILE